MDINDKELTVVDGSGKEHIVEILFTYDNEERGAKYVLFFEKDNPDEIIAMKYTEDGELIEIEDEEEYAEVEEVFQAYEDDPKIQDLKK